jgi:ATP-dependent Clp protease ATP-binding subunit ClpB
VDALARRLADRRLQLHVTPAARELLALEGWDPAYGARPLRRLVQREIGDALARELLSGGVQDGDAVLVDTSSEPLGTGRDHRALSVRRLAPGEVVPDATAHEGAPSGGSEETRALPSA